MGFIPAGPPAPWCLAHSSHSKSVLEGMTLPLSGVTTALTMGTHPGMFTTLPFHFSRKNTHRPDKKIRNDPTSDVLVFLQPISSCGDQAADTNLVMDVSRP